MAQNPDGIKLAIADMGMPFMDGSTTVLALRKVRPDLNVILASGSDMEDKVEGNLKHIKHDAFLSKPFTSETLLKTVHQVLQKKP